MLTFPAVQNRIRFPILINGTYGNPPTPMKAVFTNKVFHSDRLHFIFACPFKFTRHIVSFLPVIRAVLTVKNLSGLYVREYPAHIHPSSPMETVFTDEVFHSDRCDGSGLRLYPFFKVLHIRHTLRLLIHIAT